MKVLLAGAGPMAVEYAKVLLAEQAQVTVLGRGAASAAAFHKATGLRPATDWERSGEEYTGFDAAIVAVSAENLSNATRKLITRGVRKILVEKPAGLTLEELDGLEAEARSTNAEVWVGYNRRFLASVRKTLELIQKFGGVRSFHFDFTERIHIVEKLNKPPRVKANWFFANSTHVVDLAFYLGGMPRELRSQTSGGLPWHPPGAVFTGSGVSETGASFSYHADWLSAGGWSLEVCAEGHKLLLKPLEQLWLHKAGQNPEQVALDDADDRRFKPGLYRQLRAYLYDEDAEPLLSLRDHVLRTRRAFVPIVNQQEVSHGSVLSV